MKICMIGKYPPIQGGVSMRNYRYAHALAQRGHQVHVVTNAKEVKPPFRMLMRDRDWSHCEADYGQGAVHVHWTDPLDRSQWHIPTSSPFVTKLASIATDVCTAHGLEVIFSFYLEPYGVAGHLAAGFTGLPHVIKTAGSDVGRLWRHPQFKTVYDHVLGAADYIVAGGQVAKELVKIGVPRARLRPDMTFTVPESVFTPEGPRLRLDEVRNALSGAPDLEPFYWGSIREDLPCIGVYGKLGKTKGTEALLDAFVRLVATGRDANLLVMGHAPALSPMDFRAMVHDRSLEGRVLQIPFLPNWRVPEFIRRCVAVCALEQDFPITFHAPIVPREVLCCGSCLVASTEMLQKLPMPERLVDGYNCLAVRDVNDIDELSGKLIQVLDAPAAARAVGARGRAAVEEAQASMDFPSALEATLARAAAGRGDADRDDSAALPKRPFDAFLSQLAIEALPAALRDDILGEVGPLEREPDCLDGLLQALSDRAARGEAGLAPVCDAVRLDLLTATAMQQEPDQEIAADSSLFRLNFNGMSAFSDAIADLVPVCQAHVSVHRFDHDVNALMSGWASGVFDPQVERRVCYAVIVRDRGSQGARTLVVDPWTARMLDLCDGVASVGEIAASLAKKSESDTVEADRIISMIERLFETGLIGLRSRESESVAAQ